MLTGSILRPRPFDVNVLRLIVHDQRERGLRARRLAFLASAAYLLLAGAALPGSPAVSSGMPALTVTLTPASVVGGNNVTAVVALRVAAPAGGIAVTLSTSDFGLAALVSPSLGPSSALAFLSVTVPAGQSSVSVQVRTFGVATAATASISATTAGESAEATVTVSPASVQSVTVTPASLVGGSSASGRITLDGAAPSTGATVTLSLIEIVGSTRTQTSAATVPATVPVNAGARFAQFTVGSVPTATPRSLGITATLRRPAVASISVLPPSVSTLRLTPASVVAGTAASGTVVLDGAAPPEGHSVQLTSNNAAVSLPATLAVRPGSKDASFRITTGLVAGTVQATIEASNATTTPLGDGSTRVPIAARSASLTVVPLKVSALPLGSALASTVAAFGGRAVPGTVILNGPAPSGGVAIALLTSNDALAPVPTISISAGRDRASFSFVTASVNAVTRVTIGAAVNARFSADGTSNTLLLPEPQASAEVVLVPIPQLQSVSAAPSPVSGGQALTVALDILIAGGGGINVPAPVATAHISVDRPELVQLPATLSVPGFMLTAVPRGMAVTGTTSLPTTDQTVTITVTLEGRSASTTVLVRAVTPGSGG